MLPDWFCEVHSLCVFRQVVPSAADKVTRQIQSKLGDYDVLQQCISGDESKHLIGIDGVPASPAPAGGSHTPFFPPASSRLQPPAEFKKPSTQHHNNGRVNNHYPHPAYTRGGFVKPADGKPPHGGRGGFPGQPVKHGSGSNNDHRSNGGIVPPKGPPQGGGGGGGSGGNNSRVHNAGRNLPRINVNQVSKS